MKSIYGAGGGGSKKKKGKEPPKPTVAQDDPALKSISFAKIQYLLCEGEVEGPLYGNTSAGLERSVLLEGTPIRSTSNQVVPQPEDLVFSFGRPNGEQTGVPGFSGISQTEAVDTLVTNGAPVSKAITGSVNVGRYYARVLLTFQGLAQSIVDGDGILGRTGDVRAYSVAYRIDYVDSVGTTRTAFNGSVDGKFSSTFQRQHDFFLEGAGPSWTITVTRLTVDDDQLDPARYNTNSAFNFSSVILSLDEKFSYPHTSMLSVGVRADNYSAIPDVSILMKGMKIEIPSNYDPIARTYSGNWDGLFKVAWSNNPAWVIRDLILNDRYGVGQYIGSDSVDKFSLYEIAQYCDEQVNSATGGTEPRFTCNLLLQSGEEAWTVLQQLSSIFRGLIYYAGELAIVAQDRDKDPVFTFSEANTIQDVSDDGKVNSGNFTYAGAARRAIHTVAIVSWDDPANNYETRIEYVTNDDAFEAYGYRPIDLRLIGVTSRGQALRAANWALLSERLLTDTVTFKTNEIAMSLRPGDVINIADTTKAALRIGGRIESVNGLDITLDKEPVNPPGGWAGAKISWMYNDADNQPQLQEADITAQVGDVVTINSTGGNTPVATFPWLIEFPGRTAQKFRVLTVAEQDAGTYEVSALRYRDDIYNAVDFDSPLQEDESYLFKPAEIGVPSSVTAQVIWDNGQAKIDIKWTPPTDAVTLFGYDLTAKEYRVQWQAGTVQEDGSIIWSGAFRELPRQVDDRELVPIEDLTIADKFRVRVATVGRLGNQSNWSDIVIADDITTWFPMPDISGLVNGNSRLIFQNQASGAQLFTWSFDGLALPPYVNGVRLEVLPNRELTEREAKGIREPDEDGRYIYGDYPLNEYAVCIFHADTNWNCRVSFITAVEGLFGETYATAVVDRLDLVPPPPDQFTVVTETDVESIAPLRRFSWSLPRSEITDIIDGGTPVVPTPGNITANWPLGKVTDIDKFLVRYKAGFDANWELGVPLFADGVPGDQRYFETELLDGGTWTVMIRSVDKTGWVSDNQAAIVINFGDAIPTNVVETYEAHTTGWTGQKVNAAVSGTTLTQVDPAEDAYYFFTFTVAATDEGTGILITTDSVGTYQWSVRRVGEDLNDPFYPNPQTDPLYPNPQTNYMYLNTSNVVGIEFHPYVPFEKLEEGTYEIACRIRSIDGVTPTVLNEATVSLDYPDVIRTMEDVSIAATGFNTVTFPTAFPNKCKALQLVLQDPPGTVTLPATAYIRGKTKTGFDVRLLDANGNIVAGLADVTAVGY